MPQMQQIETQYVINSQSATNVTINSSHAIELLVDFAFLANTQKILSEQSELGIIGHVNESGFELDFNKMKTGEKYIFDYYDSKYMAIKNNDGNVELSEITINE